MAELTFTITAGLLVRGHIRRAIKTYCFAKGYGYSIDEDKALLQSLMLVKIEVPNIETETALTELKRWAKGLETA